MFNFTNYIRKTIELINIKVYNKNSRYILRVGGHNKWKKEE